VNKDFYFMNKISIFTDGASRGNPGPGGWGSVIVSEDRVKELGERADSTTNNRMELTACAEALETVKDAEITVYTDSSYVINGITKWVRGWKANGWVTKTKDEVLNRDLWEKLVSTTEGKNVTWEYVGGHSGIAGNERCDEIATSFADKLEIELFSGALSDYPIKNILDLSHSVEKVSKKSHSNAKAYSYVSMIDGKIQIHATWAECEARVKGKSGARFKKAISQEQEQEIIADFTKCVL
jgi:ribonuclease HI